MVKLSIPNLKSTLSVQHFHFGSGDGGGRGGRVQLSNLKV